jgi:hypothetical protein
MNWRREAAKTAASDEPTVHWREPSDYPVAKFEQDRDAPRRRLKHRMNLLTQNLHLTPSTQQAQKVGFTREEITRRASQFSLKINKRQSS